MLRLKRVRFRVGDKVKTQADQSSSVKEVLEQHGLLIYVGENQRLPEAELSDHLSLARAAGAFVCRTL